MSRTFTHKPEFDYYKGKPKRPNILGICNCQQCKRARRGQRDSGIMRLKKKLRNWNTNKPLKKRGVYTD